LLGDKVKEYSLVDTFGGNTIAWYAIGLLSILSIGVLGWYTRGDEK
jgi:hypothetical protein